MKSSRSATARRVHAALLSILLAFSLPALTPPPAAADSPFTDIEDSDFIPEIEWLYEREITRGCNADGTHFCPTGVVSREQMASFLARALDLPEPIDDYFEDDTGSVHENDINKMFEAEITLGCGGTNYCPGGLVLREQMASFIARALDLPPTGENYFDDDDESVDHEADINRFAEAEITLGCGVRLFCPRGNVTREQMAAFLYRALAIPPVADFSASATAGTAPLAVTFTDASTGEPTAWLWDFGDETTSTVQHPEHTYTEPGTYTVSLTASNADGEDTETKADYITVSLPVPVADFSGTPTSGPAPLTIEFSDTSTGSPTSWLWDFGDGNTATVQHPEHTYEEDGNYSVSLTATNAAGSDTETKIDYVAVGADEVALDASFTGLPAAGEAPLSVSFTDTSTGAPTAWSWDFGDGGTSTEQNPSYVYAVAGTYDVSLTVTSGDQDDTETRAAFVVVEEAPEPVPDPADVAPELDAAAPENFADASSFLYSGPNPIQTGVAAGAIDEQSVGVTRGRVLLSDGTGLGNVSISVLGQPDLGETRTRDDGVFDLAVNGGQTVTLSYLKPGYLPLQREVEVPVLDSTWLPDVVLLPYDGDVDSVDLTDNTVMQVAQGTPTVDDSGSRQASVLFPAGIGATMVAADGTETPLESLEVRITEYTAGPQGPAAMPADLPVTSGYTYAVDLSVDAAINAGGADIQFDAPVYSYTENFLGFPVGGIVPAGYLDRNTGEWVASENGLVIGVVSVDDGMAAVDVDGDAVADDDATLASLGFTDDERIRLASMYGPGDSLWRVPITHFTPWDYNWPYTCGAECVEIREQCEASGQSPEACQAQAEQAFEESCGVAGSIVDCPNQVLGEQFGVVGTPFTLNYWSDRTAGRTTGRSIRIPLSPPTVPETLKRIELEVTVAGQVFRQTFGAEANQAHTFVWDGLDGYGRAVQGNREATVRIGYVYGAVYVEPAEFDMSFGTFPQGGAELAADMGRLEITRWSTSTQPVGGFDSRALGLGGLTLDAHHILDPSSGVILGGGGRAPLPTGDTIQTVAGGGFGTEDGGPATDASLFPRDVVALTDGTLFVADTSGVVYRVDPAGTIARYAGGGEVPAPSADGGLALDAVLTPEAISIGPDGALYIAEPVMGDCTAGDRSPCGRIRRVDADGIITTVAGGNPFHGLGDGAPATAATMDPYDVVFGPDGAMYIADMFFVGGAENTGARIRRVDLSGIIDTFAGGNQPGPFDEDGNPDFGDGGPALDAHLAWAAPIAFGPDGSLYLVDQFWGTVRQIDPAGVIDTIAGGGGDALDDVPATSVALVPTGVAADDGNVYIADFSWYEGCEDACGKIRRVGPDGMISTLAGRGRPADGLGDGGPALSARLEPMGVTLGPDGNLYVPDQACNSLGLCGRVRLITRQFPSLGFGTSLVPSPDGSQAYEFDGSRHSRTLDPLTGAVIYSFGYDASGLLVTVADGYGNVTTIERGEDGLADAIVGPYGHRTELVIGEGGYVETLTNPAGEAFGFEYGAGGLLTTLTDPNGGAYLFTYDAAGRLTGEEDPGGGIKILTRTASEASQEVRLETGLGQVTIYQTERLADGGIRSVTTDPSGGLTTVVATEAQTEVTYPDGTTAVLRRGGDPTWDGLLTRPSEVISTTPGGLTQTNVFARTTSLADPTDPLSVASIEDTFTANDRVTVWSYDGATRTATTTSPEGRARTTVLDENGRIVELRLAPEVDPITYSYDTRGRVVLEQQGLQSWTYTYDSLGRLQSKEDAGGNETLFEYDAADRLIMRTLPNGEIFEFTYDANGNRTGVEMPSGEIHALDYNGVNLRGAYVAPGGATFGREYDGDRRVSSLSTPSGDSIAYTYDGGGRLADRTYGTVSAAFAYVGETDRLASMVRDDGSDPSQVAFTYDGDLVTSVTASGPSGGSYAYTYDDNLYLVGSQLAVGSSVASIPIVRDADGLPTEIGDHTLTRGGPGGALSAVSDGTQHIALEYDELGRIARRAVSVEGTEQFVETLEYDGMGRIAARTETVAGTTTAFGYSYDPNGQLTSVSTDGTVTETYGYDGNGNRTSSGSVTATYDAQDRITGHGATTYELDADGFLVSRGTDTFDYSPMGELVSAEVSGQQITYEHDALGRRVARVTSAGTEQYLYGNLSHPFQLTASVDVTGELTGYLYDDNGSLIALRRGASLYYVAVDHLGTPRLVLSGDGTVVKAVVYDSFGRRTADSNTAFSLPIGFAGGLEDPDTGLVRFGFRDYDSAAGRWTARDPVLYGGGQANLYVYVGNNPVLLTDPFGLAACIGGSFFAGLGLGGQICVGSGGVSACVEGGVGLGWSVEPSSTAQETGFSAGVSASCGGVGGAIGASFTVNNCGSWEFGMTARASAGPEIAPGVRMSTTATDDGTGSADGGNRLSGGSKVEAGRCGLKASAVVRKCVGSAG